MNVVRVEPSPSTVASKMRPQCVGILDRATPTIKLRLNVNENQNGRRTPRWPQAGAFHRHTQFLGFKRGASESESGGRTLVFLVSAGGVWLSQGRCETLKDALNLMALHHFVMLAKWVVLVAREACKKTQKPRILRPWRPTVHEFQWEDGRLVEPPWSGTSETVS
jgi:hypothetical protein